MKRFFFLSVLLLIGTAQAKAQAEIPDLDYYRVDNLPIFGHDAPVISNNWLWARADDGVLNMQNVRCGVRKQFDGTIEVKVNSEVVKTDPLVVTWWPNKRIINNAVSAVYPDLPK